MNPHHRTKILILNGPNLNMLGQREPDIYGYDTLDDVETLCEKTARIYGIYVDFRQSNHEGELVTWIQESGPVFDALIINAAAYTHTSVAIHDALKMLSMPIIEVHISDPETRETFRHHSYIKPLAHTMIAGHGIKGYAMAIDILATLLSEEA